MLRQGAVSCDIISRAEDMGVDLIATFLVAGALEQRVGIQVKYYYKDDQPAGSEVVDQLVTGMDAEGITLGMVVSAGSFKKEVEEVAQKRYDSKGYSIELIDGEMLAGFLVDLGFSRE